MPVSRTELRKATMPVSRTELRPMAKAPMPVSRSPSSKPHIRGAQCKNKKCPFHRCKLGGGGEAPNEVGRTKLGAQHKQGH